ncbi:hypothetical protein BACCIP111895_03350 [Neobacillus rhizosphaerae]|uniref:DUF2568 domain-containing protein n=1 Tax=Neobacillus rhizosphaerae TaxID=2880965 RepID=A0ABN8KUV1_9BACI|nr:YrdB family protein [Neobacillus rhizosphaerae]CAH2716166.1 hypothetical protein BACCIP111895_03350 [Neobacillus rhizosphaerae]
MEAIKMINLGVRFLLEILALVIFGYWGFRISQGTMLKIGLGIGTPLLAAVIWGMFGSPKAPYLLSGIPFFLLEIIIFGFPAIALYFTGKHGLAFIYGLITVINLVLLKVWKQ